MSRRIRARFRKHRLSLLLLGLAYTAIFYGSSCDCDCSTDPFWIRSGGEKQEEIWAEENTPSTHSLELVAGKKDVTVSNVTWSITSAPSEGIIKPDGYEIAPMTGQNVSLKLSPQPSFKAAAIRTISYHNSLFTKMGVKAGFTSSDAQGTQTVERDLFIHAMQPSLHVHDDRTDTSEVMIHQGNPVSGKRAIVDCVVEQSNASRSFVLKVSVVFGSGGKPYQFFAAVGPSNKQYLTVNRIVSMDPELADIHLTVNRGGTPPGDPTEYAFPLLLRAEGANGVVATDIMYVNILR